MKRRVGFLLLAVFSSAIAVLVPSAVWAQQASSTSYSVDEAYFGTGGELNACSTTYCTKQSAGELGVGNSGSTSYQVQGGQNTNREESLQLIVNNNNTDLGTLSPGSASKTVGTFSVMSYLSSGYVVVNGSDPPTSNGPNPHIFNAMAPTFPGTQTSSPGTEQFGINLVANSTVPSSADPVQNGTFGLGAAASGYSTTNQFRYAKGETIASSSKESGLTTYTVSYLYNIAGSTPAGTYTFNHVIIATPTF